MIDNLLQYLDEAKIICPHKNKEMDDCEEEHPTLPSNATHNKYFVHLTHTLFRHKDITVATDVCKGDNTFLDNFKN